MSLRSIVESAVEFFSAYPFIAIGILVVFAFFAYFQFKVFAKMIVGGLILGAIVYVVLFLFNLGSTGMDNVEKFRAAPGEVMDKIR